MSEQPKNYRVRMELTVARYVYVKADDEQAALDSVNSGVWDDEERFDSDMTDWKAIGKAEVIS